MNDKARIDDSDKGGSGAGSGGEPAAEPHLGPDGKPMAPEYGGYKGPEPTRHGDWDVNGRVSDF